MLASGAEVRAYDPAAAANALPEEPELVVVDHADKVFEEADAVVIGTEWPEFSTLDWVALGALMR